MGDAGGSIHVWNLKTDHNEQLVSVTSFQRCLSIQIYYKSMRMHFQIPEPDSSIQSVSIDRKGRHLAAVNNKVRMLNLDRATKLAIHDFSCRDHFNAGKLLHLELNRW